jgi:hypothetical protein
VYLLPPGLDLEASKLAAIRAGQWEAFHSEGLALPSAAFLGEADPAWGPALASRFAQELVRTRGRLAKLDRRLHRDLAARDLGMDPERLRQHLFPRGLPQERVLPGLLWLRDDDLLDRMLDLLQDAPPVVLMEAR